MTPATPPTSRGRRGSRIVYSFEEALEEQKRQNEPQTPHREQQSQAPVTPSTTRAFKHSVPLLAPPSNQASSPFRGFNSPEYTPHNKLPKNKGFSFEQPGELQNVSRVLFPASGEGKLQTSEVPPAPLSLLPPRRPISSTRRLSNALSKDLGESDEETSHKVSKRVPGTPSHKVVTFDLAQEWNNATERGSDSDDDDFTPESCIKHKELQNPFQSAEPLDEMLIEQRKESLLRENPNIDSEVTYVNKKGDVVRRRQLSEEEKDIYKPKRLFAEEIRLLEAGKKTDKKKGNID